jgi:activator of HSP90 ATPase
MGRLIRQSATLHAAPHAVYEALMDSRQHARFTGSPARMSRKVGGAFSAFGDYISGTNLELVPDKKIVQAWHASEWPEGHVSKVTYRLFPVKAGTRLDFTHSGVPDRFYDDIKQGWIDNYWQPLRARFNKA